MRFHWLLAVLFLGGCTMSPLGVRSVSQSADSSTKAPTTYNSGLGTSLGNLEGIDRYYPIKKTYTWRYRVAIKDDTGTQEVTDTTRIEAYSGTGDNKSATYTTKRYDGSTLLAMDNGTMTQNSLSLTIEGGGGTEVISLPLTPGKTWTSGVLTAQCYTVGAMTVLDKPYKDVLAIAYVKDGETKAVRWLAPGVGIIRQVSRSIVNGKTTEVTSELQTAQVSGVTSVTLLPATLSVTVGATRSLNAQVYYDDGSAGREFTISSSDPSIAFINELGYLEGEAQGTASVTAISTQDSSKFATISVTVL